MKWRIAQEGESSWRVYKGDDSHWATTAKDAVALMLALEEAGR